MQYGLLPEGRKIRKMISHNSCPLCSGNVISHFLTCTDHLVSSKEFELSRCSSCGFIFTSAPPDEKEIGGYYESDNYISHSDSGKALLDKIYHLVRRIMLTGKRMLVKQNIHRPTGKILDLGCGTGYFLDEMKKSGWETTGVEVNKKAREHAVSRFGLEVFPPDAISSLPGDEYDCITLWHVLEHFHDPFEYFREIKRLLKPGGTVLVALPNSDSFDAIHYKKDWAAFDVPRHLWHFNTETLTLFAKKAGFSVTSMKLLPFDVFYISILSEKQKGSFFPSLFGMTMGKMYFLLSLFDKRKGSSIVYTLKIPAI
jgi:2-polyprenyl-3-methyl-5-hydroxy-6-metoxy-1,4-benzoquinol methylase